MSERHPKDLGDCARGGHPSWYPEYQGLCPFWMIVSGVGIQSYVSTYVDTVETYVGGIDIHTYICTVGREI